MPTQGTGLPGALPEVQRCSSSSAMGICRAIGIATVQAMLARRPGCKPTAPAIAQWFSEVHVGKQGLTACKTQHGIWKTFPRMPTSLRCKPLYINDLSA